MSAFTLACAIVGFVAVVLVVRQDYEDGLFGRIALGGLILGAVIVVLQDVATKVVIDVPNEVMMMAWAVAIFMLRHLYRFLRYVRAGSYAWKPHDGREVLHLHRRATDPPKSEANHG